MKYVTVSFLCQLARLCDRDSQIQREGMSERTLGCWMKIQGVGMNAFKIDIRGCVCMCEHLCVCVCFNFEHYESLGGMRL